MNKTVCIFGATGLVGAYAAIGLKRAGWSVVAVGRRSCDNGFFRDEGIEYVSLDVKNASGFSNLPGTIDKIVHLAGPMPSKMRGYSPEQYVAEIVNGTLNVLNYARAARASSIVFSHTRADSNYLMGGTDLIPDDIVRKFPLRGDHAVYTICKNAAVDLLEHYFHEYGLKRFVLRLPTIYGYTPDPHYCVDGQPRPMGYRIIIERAVRGLPVEIWGDPLKRKEIVYVKDLVELIRCALDSDRDGGVYNVGTGVGVSLEQQIRGIVDVFSAGGRRSEIVYRPDLPDGRQFIHDISKARTELGFSPKYDYIALLRDFKRDMDINPFRRLWGDHVAIDTK